MAPRGPNDHATATAKRTGAVRVVVIVARVFLAVVLVSVTAAWHDHQATLVSQHARDS
jgi:type II secretory pathway component PulL